MGNISRPLGVDLEERKEGIVRNAWTGASPHVLPISHSNDCTFLAQGRGVGGKIGRKLSIGMPLKGGIKQFFILL